MCKGSLDTLASSLSLVFGGLVSEPVVFLMYCLFHCKFVGLRLEILELELGYSSSLSWIFRINF